MMGKAATIFMVFAIIATLVFGAWGTVRIVSDVEFNTNCKQYLKRAADANTVETAKEELSKAISYAEDNNLTESYSELENLSEDATSLEKTNVLMKLRETLTDETDSGVKVTVPNGISIYPNNVSYFWWGLLSVILAFVFWIMTLVAYENCWD